MENKYVLEKRNSNIELLRIIAIFLIIMCHSTPWYGTEAASLPSYVDLGKAVSDWHIGGLMLFRYAGMVGDCLFFVASFWFLVDRDTVNKRKIFDIISDSFFISIIFLFFFVISDVELGETIIVEQFFPIYNRLNWFVGCYLIMYVIHPVINKIIKSFNKSVHLSVLLFFVVVYCVINLLCREDHLYYTSIVGCIGLYFVVAYVKKYMSETVKINNVRLLITGVIGIVLSFVLGNWLGLKIGNSYMIIAHRWCTFINPAVMLTAISMFYYFKGLEVKRSNVINEVASCSLLFYLFYENYLFRNYIKSDIWLWLYNKFSYNHIILIAFILSLIAFLVTLIVSLLYKYTLKNIVNKVGEVVLGYLLRIIGMLKQIILRI